MEINYKTIMDLGFEEEFCSDSVYFDEYGFEYSIISLKLAKHIYLEWSKESRTCEIMRIDKDYNVIRRKKISGEKELKEIVDFFKGN